MGTPSPAELILLEKWEDLRAVKNLLGRYVLDILNNRAGVILEKYWSETRKDICYGLNSGWYYGREALCEYYEALTRSVYLKAALIKNAFPDKLAGKSVDELYGAGPFYDLPNSTPVIEIAADGQTAKGLWYCHGTYADLFSSGIQSHWTWGYYAADFVKEDGLWKLWHLCWLNDADTLCGQTWTRENIPYPEEADFAQLRGDIIPAPNKPALLWEYYSPRRRFIGTPRIPEPYESFGETFSYGPCREVQG